MAPGASPGRVLAWAGDVQVAEKSSYGAVTPDTDTAGHAAAAVAMAAAVVAAV